MLHATYISEENDACMFPNVWGVNIGDALLFWRRKLLVVCPNHWQLCGSCARFDFFSEECALSVAILGSARARAACMRSLCYPKTLSEGSERTQVG